MFTLNCSYIDSNQAIIWASLSLWQWKYNNSCTNGWTTAVMFHNLLQRNNGPPHLSTTRPYKICIFIQRSFILAKIYIVVPIGIRMMKEKFLCKIIQSLQYCSTWHERNWSFIARFSRVFNFNPLNIRKLKKSFIGRFYRVFNFTPLGIRKTEDKVLLQELPVSSVQVVR